MNFEWMYVLDAWTKAQSNEDQALEPLRVSPDQQSRWNHKADPCAGETLGLFSSFCSFFWCHLSGDTPSCFVFSSSPENSSRF